MGPTLSALVRLQKIEIDLSQLRRRIRTRQNAITSQETRIEKHREENDALKHTSLERRKQADGFELDLRESEERVAKLRAVLNAAKTNKEYASVLTEINTHKADNAKLEEQGLKILAEVDSINSQADAIANLITEDEKRLEEIKSSSSEEIAQLESMVTELLGKRIEAAQAVPSKALSLFERIAQQYDSEALAKVEVSGPKPPHSYTCGGCFMGLNAEHANALGTKDEIRQCDNCKRILYMDESSG